MTVGEALREGTERLTAAGVAEAPLEAALLLAETTGMSRAQVLAHSERLLDGEEERRFLSFLTGREGRCPLAYLTGEREFMGLSFRASEAALIPRQDTETLVEEAMRHLHDGMHFLDLCTGTGCVALSLLRYSNGTTAVATDAAKEALALATENAAALALADRVRLVCADLFPKDAERFDLIVANPPYIATGALEDLMPEVRDFEPRIALDGGADGLDFYRRILAGAAAYLYAGGWLLVEIGFDQGGRVRELFEEEGFHGIEVVRDLGGKDRVVKGCCY